MNVPTMQVIKFNFLNKFLNKPFQIVCHRSINARHFVSVCNPDNMAWDETANVLDVQFEQLSCSSLPVFPPNCRQQYYLEHMLKSITCFNYLWTLILCTHTVKRQKKFLFNVYCLDFSNFSLSVDTTDKNFDGLCTN